MFDNHNLFFFSLALLSAISKLGLITAYISILRANLDTVNRFSAHNSLDSQWLPKLVGQQCAGGSCVPGRANANCDHGLALDFC